MIAKKKNVGPDVFPQPAQTPYCCDIRSRSAAGNWSVKRFQPSSPTWFLKPCRICKTKVFTFRYIYFQNYSNLPWRTAPSGRAVDWSKMRLRRRRRWSRARCHQDWRLSCCTFHEMRNPSLRCLECFEATCTCTVDLFVLFVFFFELVKRSFDDSKRKEMNRKLVAETVKADKLVIRYLNENEKRMRIKKKEIGKIIPPFRTRVPPSVHW